VSKTVFICDNRNSVCIQNVPFETSAWTPDVLQYFYGVMDLSPYFLVHSQRTSVSTMCLCTWNKSTDSRRSKSSSTQQLLATLRKTQLFIKQTTSAPLTSFIFVASGSTCCHKVWEEPAGPSRPSISIGNRWLVCSKHFKPPNKADGLDEQQFKHNAWHFSPAPTFSKNLPQQDTGISELIIIINRSDDFCQYTLKWETCVPKRCQFVFWSLTLNS
jgi:hypothetical protein